MAISDSGYVFIFSIKLKMKTDRLLLATMLSLFSFCSIVLRHSPTDARFQLFFPGLQGTDYLVTDHCSTTPNLTMAFNKTSKGVFLSLLQSLIHKMWKVAAVPLTAIVMLHFFKGSHIPHITVQVPLVMFIDMFIELILLSIVVPRTFHNVMSWFR